MFETLVIHMRHLALMHNLPADHSLNVWADELDRVLKDQEKDSRVVVLTWNQANGVYLNYRRQHASN
ncbi:hypothetical protein [Hafnia phage yong3]|nr:hypothetical protein [Hafnia phage yong3]